MDVRQYMTLYIFHVLFCKTEGPFCRHTRLVQSRDWRLRTLARAESIRTESLSYKTVWHKASSFLFSFALVLVCTSVGIAIQVLNGGVCLPLVC